MFGDYGHGSLIFLVAALLVLYHDRLKGGAFDSALALRYILLMMGAAAMFSGLLYNEFFAIPNDWFGSCFDTSQRKCTSADSSCNAVFYPVGCTDPS
jgi:vacuolar-type H+-ATPase subunit I/STV1